MPAGPALAAAPSLPPMRPPRRDHCEVVRARSHTLSLAGIALGAALAAFSCAGCAGSAGPKSRDAGAQALASAFDGAEIQQAPPAAPFTLSDPHGAGVALSHYRGHVVVLSFLYPTCGATCVLVAQQIRGALDELGHPVPVLFVSAKPSADTRASVARFLSSVSLSRRAEYLSGPLSRLRQVWRSYRITPAESDPARFKRDITVMLIDQRGRERVVYGLEQLTPEALAHDIRTLEQG